MFEELTDYLEAIVENVDDVLSHDYTQLAQESIDAVARAVLHRTLVSSARKAAIQTGEYSYPPLLEHFTNHFINHPEHIEVTEGRVIRVFDPEIAGGYGLFEQGLVRGGQGHTGTQQAPFVWKYGIYMTAHGGGGLSDRLAAYDLPSYEDVIAERLEIWGDQIPYWYLIENGNAGTGREFPTFNGTHFIDQLEARAQGIVDKLAEIYLEDNVGGLLESLSDRAEEIATVPRKGTHVTIARFTINAFNVSRQITSRGNIFYRIGNRMYTPEQMMGLVQE